MQRKSEPVPNPTQEGLCAPTQPTQQTVENVKFDFVESFDRPVFKEMSPEWRFTKSNKNKRVKMDGRGVPRYFPTV